MDQHHSIKIALKLLPVGNLYIYKLSAILMVFIRQILTRRVNKRNCIAYGSLYGTRIKNLVRNL